MEATRPRPPGVLDAASLPEVAGACTARGPFVTVYLTTEPAVENAGPLAELRWKRLRRDLLDAGAPNEALGAIDPLVDEPGGHAPPATLPAGGEVVVGEDVARVVSFGGQLGQAVDASGLDSDDLGDDEARDSAGDRRGTPGGSR
jgi:hypothetical protein